MIKKHTICILKIIGDGRIKKEWNNSAESVDLNERENRMIIWWLLGCNE